MLQSAAVWRRMHTADRITKKWVWDPQLFPGALRKVHRTRQWGESTFRGEVGSNVEWLSHTSGDAAHRYDNTLWQSFWTYRLDKVQCCACPKVSRKKTSYNPTWLAGQGIWLIIRNRCRWHRFVFGGKGFCSCSVCSVNAKQAAETSPDLPA